jgi:hypothetical protein
MGAVSGVHVWSGGSETRLSSSAWCHDGGSQTGLGGHGMSIDAMLLPRPILPGHVEPFKEDTPHPSLVMPRWGDCREKSLLGQRRGLSGKATAKSK